MAASLDLAGLQRDRDREVRAGRAIVAARIDSLAVPILKWAERADRARVRLAADDSEAVYLDRLQVLETATDGATE